MVLHGAPGAQRSVVARPRLSERLEADVPLRAPAGFGKSALLISWARSTSRRGVWLRADPALASPVDVVVQIAGELIAAGIGAADGPLGRISADLSPSEAWGALRRSLLDVGEDVIVAVDDGDALDAETVASLVRTVADTPTLGVRIALRTAGVLSESGLRLLVDIDVVAPEELALTAAEAAMVLDVEPDSVQVQELLAHGGVPVLAQLMRLHGHAHADEIVHSLLRLRSADLDPYFLRFMETIALAGSVDVAFAVELTGRTDAEALLDRVEAEGFGRWSSPAPRFGDAEFVLAPFARGALMERARRHEGSGRLHAMGVAIARRELARGQLYAAVRGALAVDDWALAGEIARDHWMDMLRYGPQLAQLLSHIPPVTLREWPHLAMLLALAYEMRDAERPRALEYFGLAAHAARRQRSRYTGADRVFLMALETTARRLLGDQDAAHAAAVDGAAALDALGMADRDRLSRSLATIHIQFGTAFLYGQEHERALHSLRQATAVGDASGSPLGLQALALQAGLHAWAGDIGDAEALIAEAEGREWPDGWRTDYHGCLVYLARARVAIEHGDPDTAEAELAMVDEHRAVCEHWTLALQIDVLIALSRRQPDAAWYRMESVLREQRRRYAVIDHAERRLRATRALVLLALDAPAEAERELVGSSAESAAIARARIALAEGQVERALRLLPSEGAHLTSRQRAGRLALTTAALCLLDPGSEGARRSVLRLHALLEAHRLWLPLALVPAHGLDAIAKTRERGSLPGEDAVERARAAAMIAARDPIPRFTQRETVVARQLMQSDSVAEISAALTVSPNTVKSQLRGIYRKLGVGSRAEALRALATQGWFIDGHEG